MLLEPIDIANEKWRAFPLNPKYEVSDQGRVRQTKTGRVRKPVQFSNGYLALRCYDGGEGYHGTNYYVHFMVMRTWVGPRPEGMQVSHQDGTRTNNRLDNLKYESRKENCNKYFNKWYKGSTRRKLSVETVKAIRADHSTSCQQWALRLGVSRDTIGAVRRYRTYKHI